MSDQTGNATTAPRTPEDTGTERPRRLVRLREDRVVCGVAAGLGAYTRTDPVLWRIGFVVLTLFSGVGAIAYLILWLAVPYADGETYVGDARRATDGGAWSGRWLGIAALVAGAAILVHNTWNLRGGLVLGVLLIGAGVALWTRGAPVVSTGREKPEGPRDAELAERAELSEREELGESAELAERDEASERTEGAEGREAPDQGDLGGGSDGLPPAQDDGGDATTPPRPRRRGRSVLGRLVLGSAALVAGAGLLLDELGALDATPVGLLAAVLVVIGVGLVVGTWWGRARWLVFPGVALALVVTTLAYAPYTAGAFADGAGERHVRPTSLAELRGEYRLGFGELVLDLSRLDLDGRARRVDARVGFGQLGVIVPEDATVAASGRAGAGEVNLFGEIQGGLGVTAETRRDGEDDAGRLLLDLDVGMGEITVAREGTADAVLVREGLDHGRNN